MINEFLKRGAIVNRRRFIYELKDIPSDIKGFHKANKKLTTVEKFISAFLQSCIRYGYVKSYRSQQIIRLGPEGRYIMADFFLHWPEVIIEVDGFEHNAWRDQWRDKRVKELFAYETIRVSNSDVVNNNAKTRARLIRELAEAEGLTARAITKRVKEYVANQKKEGYY